MKKEYIQPAMRVVALKHQTHILAGSYGNQKSVSVYNDPDDAITDTGDVW